MRILFYLYRIVKLWEGYFLVLLCCVSKRYSAENKPKMAKTTRFSAFLRQFHKKQSQKRQGPGKFQIPSLLAKKSMLLKLTDGQFENAKVKSKGVNCGIRRLVYFELQVPGASHWARQGLPVGLGVIDKLFSFGVPTQLAS